ncbi:MAG TPA: hypothetical protein VFE82_15480 [Ramlibacter sp.]|jgi:hypothetical protein|uniref:DUF7673 family protein n=1 Tax=Ramlibacter sp. TaxID=1917967 RepID=UPI002D547241|nr:hypothetical protein [Ramlibacter sp.]HZY19874.1 hypothetical protein [Ramlibacter sp.]
MTHTERERRHRATLDKINQVQLVVGRADRPRVDHEGTLLERARLLAEELSAHRATEQGLLALDRLLRMAEDRTSPQARDIATFVAALWGSKPLPLGTLRGPDPSSADDMLAVLDAFRHARLSLVEHVAGGPARVQRVLEKWRLPST